MKKYLIIVLVLLLLVVYVPVTSAETQTFYSVRENSGTNVASGHQYKVNSSNTDEYDLSGCYSFSKADYYVTFNVEIPEDGNYSLYAYCGGGSSNTIRVTEGETVLSEKTISTTGKSYYVSRSCITESAAFTAGTHSIILTNVSGTGILFGISVEPVISDEIYAGKSDSTIVLDDVVSMIRGGWISYKITPEAAGRYLLKLSAKSTENTFLNVSVDGEAASNIKMLSSTDYADNYTYVNLKDSSQTLKLFDANGKTDIKAFELTPVTGDSSDDKALLDAINSSDTVEGVYNSLKTYGATLGIDIDDLLSEIWYKDAVYGALIDRDFDTLDELLYTLSGRIAQEKALPTIALLSNGEKIDDLCSGNFTFEIDNSQQKLNSAVMVGIYEQTESAKKLVAVSGTTRSGVDKVTATFTNMVIDNPENYTWQLFNFETKESMKPYNAFDNIYKEFYVSAKGNDANDGSINSPFATLGKAKQAAAEISANMTGDIIINIAGGEYTLSDTEIFTPENSGKNGYNIIYRGTDKDNPPIFSGGKQVTGWTKGDDGIWQAPLSGVTEVRNLYIDGIAAERSRSAYAYIYLEDYDDETTEATVDSFVTSTGQFPEIENPADLETVWEIGWETQRAPVETIKTVDGKKVITFPNGDYWTVGSKDIKAGRRFYLENAKELLDTEGEFFYDKGDGTNGTIYYYPYEEEDFDNAKKYVAVTEKLVAISGESKTNKVKNLVFDNIKFKYGADNTVSTNGLMGRQAESYYDNETKEIDTFVFDGQFAVNMADNIKIKNCEFSSLGSVAVAMRDGVSNVLFEGNVIKDTSGGAVSIGTYKHSNKDITDDMEICRNITVKNNVIRRIATEYRQECAISVYYENGVTIKNNDIKHSPYTGITAGWGWTDTKSRSAYMRNLDISNNKIVNSMENMDDGASVYTLGPIHEGRIAENYLAKNRLRDMVGIYLDSGSANLNVHDNLILSNEIYFMRLQTGNGVKNNKIYNNYSNTSTPSINATAINTETYPNVYEDAIVVNEESLTPEAQSIYDNAGLEPEYSYLLSGVETPEYMRNYNNTKPKREYIDCVGGVIEFEDYITSKNSTHYGYEVGMTKNGEATFEVDVPEAGMYNMHLPEVRSLGSNTVVNVNVNSDTEYSVTFPYDSSDNSIRYTETVLVYLEEGTNTLTITTPQSSAHFDYFYFTKSDKLVYTAGDTLEIEAEKFSDEGLLEVSSVNNTYVSFHPDGWLEYYVYSPEAAEYDLSVFTATTQNYLYMRVYVNDALIRSKSLPNTGSHSTYKETVVGTVTLNKGFNRIRLNLWSSNVNGLHFDKFVLTK